jgi:hypothetical protein
VADENKAKWIYEQVRVKNFSEMAGHSLGLEKKNGGALAPLRRRDAFHL